MLRLSKEATLGKMMTSIFKVPEPALLLGVLPSGFEDFFQATSLTLVGSGLMLIAVALLLGRA